MNIFQTPTILFRIRYIARAAVFLTLIGTGFSESYGQQGHPVSGQVVDEETGQGLEGAHVFYSGTRIGDVTNRIGRFQLPASPSMTIDVVISMIGYETKTYGINFLVGETADLYVRLVPSVTDMDSVTVSAEFDTEWNANLTRFKEHFFGESKFGKSCRLLNPLTLDFTYDSRAKELKSSADEALILVNDALGYRIEFHSFTLDASPRYFQWNGSVRFVELDSYNPDEGEKWRVNRASAYQGSTRHFLTALVRSNLVGEQFEAYHVGLPRMQFHKFPIPEMGGVKKLAEYEYEDQDAEYRVPILSPGPETGLYSVEAPNTLFIVYRGEEEEEDFDTEYGSSDSRYQSNWLYFDGASIIVDYNGNILSTEDIAEIARLGYWAWERVCDMLPTDYKPESASVEQ